MAFKMVTDIGRVTLPSTLWAVCTDSNPVYIVSNIYSEVHLTDVVHFWSSDINEIEPISTHMYVHFE